MSHDDLKHLSWRYVALIGSVHGVVPDELLAADRQRWPHFLRLREGEPEFRGDDCVVMMVELSGASPEDCRKVMLEQWGSVAEQHG